MTDFLIEGGLIFNNGDLLTGDSSEQSRTLLLITEPGEWKENPDLGVGIRHYLESEEISTMLREIRLQFRADGQQVSTVSYENGKLLINEK